MSSTAKHRFSRTDLDALLDRAIEQNGSVIIKRPGRPDVALISLEKLREVDTTEYLMASPKNRRRLLGALHEARAGRGRSMSVRQLRKIVGLNK